MLLEILKNEFHQRRERNSQYSLRAFAKSLKIHSSTLSAILNGKRKVTANQAEKILRELNVDPMQRKQILLSYLNSASSTAKSQASYEVLEEEIFNVVSSWKHFALLACLDLHPRGESTENMATKLKLPVYETRECLERLHRSRLIERRESRWHATGRRFSTSTDIPSQAIRQVNHEYIVKALSSLQSHNVEERDITGITMAISSKKLGVAKKMIANFRRELAEYLESANHKDEVYRLNIQLFPLSK